MKKESSNDYMESIDFENQEHLTKGLLDKFIPTILPKDEYDRPASSFIDLMWWVQKSFGHVLTHKKNLNRFVHNRINIDGQFLHFCKENGITVKCLYKDSIISWKTDNEFEKFFVQGVFLIKTKDTEFLHAALFHKGNSNEDEVSFFIIIDNEDYDSYISLRNKFDNWVQSRDRENLLVEVIGGDNISYTKDCSWDDLFLPENIKSDIRVLVEGFLESKDFYIKNRIPWKRGLLLYGAAGNGKTTIIRTIMSVYNFKPVTIISDGNSEAVREAFSYAQEQSPSLLYFEDLDSLLERGVDISSFLNLMDGISTQNGLLIIATANDVKKLKTNITNRPSRFDRKFEIPLPTQEMAYIYLNRWFGNLIDARKRRELAKYAEKYEFSYAYLKELYLSAMFEALSHNRKIPTNKDVDNALNCLIKDKNILNNGRVNTDKYFNK